MWQVESLRRVQQLIKNTSSNIEQFELDKRKLQTSLEESTEKLDEYENIIFGSKLVIEKITYESKKNLESFLTYALKNIFTDRDYEILFELKEDTKKPGLELTLVESGIKQEITDAVGGGIVSTLGLLLQIYYIEVFGINKVILIDEGLKELSSTKLSDGLETEDKSYLENLLAFLKWLSAEKQYKLVLVTHDDKVREYADKVYEVKKGSVREC